MSFLENRQLVPAENLTGPRVYSTDLHASHFQKGREDDLILTTARALKTKLLTKGTVTIHMSHLLSPGGVLFLANFPDALQCEAILPVFREDKKAVDDYLADHEEAYSAAGIDNAKVKDAVSLLAESCNRVMPWQLGDVHAQYKDRILAGLNDPGSNVRLRLLKANGNDSAQIDALVQRLEDDDFSEDASMRRFLSETDEAIRPILKYYEQAVYHIVGTSVVNCESGTDLSLASNFSALAVSQGDDPSTLPSISPFDVFTRLFLGEAFEAMQSGATPVTVLDTMTFADVDRINKRLREAEFHDRYDEVVRTAMDSMRGTSREALESFDGEAFADMACTIHKDFVSAIEDEIKEYESKAFEEAKADAIGQTQKIGLSIAGAAPGLGALVTLYQVAEAYPAFTKATKKGAKLATPGNLQLLGPEMKREALNKLIEEAELSAKSKTRLLDGAKLLCDFNEAKVARF